MIDSRIEKIQSFWNTLDIKSLDTLGKIYATDVQFEDPLSKGKGLEQLQRHFERMYRKYPEITYEYGRSMASSTSLVIEWTMKTVLGNPKHSLDLPGVSFLEMEIDSGLISNSREYFDLGLGLYQQVPLVGAIVKFVKSKAVSIRG